MKTKSDEVINDLLGYPGLKIIQRPDMFNFSLDSTILAYFVTINKTTKRIIDLGCGNGFVPIFLTLRTDAFIEGVEIQEEAYNLAVKSVRINSLEDKIKIHLGDMKDIYKEVGVATYDVVTCNPPYFIYKEDSLTNITEYLTIARHEVKVNLNEVLHSANILLKDGGIFSMVHRVERLMDILAAFRENSIEPKRILFIYPKITSKEAKVVFIEGIKSKKKGGLKILPPLYVYDEENKYTKEILKIFNYPKE